MSSVFISHSSASAAEVSRIEQAFAQAGVPTWLDHSDLGLGILLRSNLTEAIQQSRAVVLVWSQKASRSRWVSAEILTAFHTNRWILPCVTDDTPLPQFLIPSAYLDLRTAGEEGLRRLVRKAAEAPEQANPLPPRVASPSGELKLACNRLGLMQESVTGPLTKRDLKAAAAAQARLDPEMADAERRWPFELMILNLAGYHRKNGYLVKHWDAIQAGRPPRDPLLRQAERFFFEAALVDPNDVNALNGLASVLIYEFELDAATLFNDRAIALSEKAGIRYDAAKHDRALIAWMRKQAERGTT